MIRLLVTDDHEIVRHGLRQLLELSEGIHVAAEAENGAQAIDCLVHGGFDLLLLDLHMPGLSGPELIALIRQTYASLPILVLSMHNEAAVVRRAMAAGASGYVCKAGDPEALVAAIRAVADGERYVDTVLAADGLA